MIKPLKPGAAPIIKATIPALEAHGVTITKTMYEKLMQDPAIAAMFNQTDQATGRQPRALAAAVLAYAKHIDDPSALENTLGLIVEKHVALSVTPEQYPVVGEALLTAIGTVLGEAATPEIIDAWAEAYRFLADVLISRETALTHTRETEPGGWRGWRSFRVAKRVQESPDMVSFWLEPVDGKPVLKHVPGQYLALALEQDGLNTRRCYSISSAPSTHAYRISVKRDPHGMVSSWLHANLHENGILEVAPPAGQFTLEASGSAPVLLVSGGSGITPFMSMLPEQEEKNPGRPMHLVHTTPSLDHMPFLAELASLQKTEAAPEIDLFSTKDENAHPDTSLRVHEGHVSAEWLAEQLGNEGHLYFCGPRGFQRDLFSALTKLGIPESRLHHEFYGPDESLLAA
ncbi:NO-inducible flavohemoprotein [Swaminathania salitolerans]|uniref:nitric oxide dioxygenase n=1 Tax=Swaminathania salitolerans TaxID=182838 RepID=A0A511BX18_9PROT|nr:NO-inducible flavohemoprotein [Swaminathania salitolerans]GBQ11591.1 flavohemoprotein [Swaminathania salitolerans LMG 21291]GEL02548.1 flavohemoprotein [Swaminathania salitolerans]